MKPLLAFTNGSEASWACIEFSAWMSAMLNTPLTLVGILEQPGANEAVQDIFHRAVTLFQQQKIAYSLQLETAQAEDLIPRKAAEQDAEMVLIGSLGRPALRRFLVGRSFPQLLADVKKPLVYVPVAHLPVQKMLLCLGGLGYGLTAEHLGIQLARAFNASLTLLTVVPPVDLDYPEARTIRDHWQTLVETDTLPGRTLRAARENARQAGVDAQVVTRHGDIVREIRTEIQTGGYQMVCMGSPHSSQSLRNLATVNITAEIAETAPCPVLAARYIKGVTRPSPQNL